MISKFSACLSLILVAGCCSAPGDFRNRVEHAAAAALPKGVQQTQFAWIGDVHTTKGTFHVATQFRVLRDMITPRGEPTRLLLFSDDARLAVVYEEDFSSGALPLWCEGSRVYLAGFGSFHLDGTFDTIPPDARLWQLFSKADRSPSGNVIDFSRGPLKPFLTREKRYGSSGGLDDNPWRSP